MVDLAWGSVREVRHLAQMGGEDRGVRALPDDARVPGDGGDAVGVQDEGLVDAGCQLPHQPGGVFVQGEAGADDHHIHLAGHFEQGLPPRAGEAPLGGFGLGKEHLRRDEGHDALGAREPRVPAAGLQEGHGGKVGGAVVAPGAGDEERLSEGALVPCRVAEGKGGGGVHLHQDVRGAGELRREGDVAHEKLPAVPGARREQAANLRQAEGEGAVGLDGASHHAARIAAHARGDVEAQHEAGGIVERAYGLGEESGHRALQAGAQECVHRRVGVEDGGAQVLDGAEGGRLDGQPAQDFEVLPGSPLVPVPVTQDEHPGRATGGKDLPGEYEAVPAVVPGAADHDEGAPADARLAVEQGARREARVLHEEQLVYPEPRGRGGIHGPHLVDRGHLHDRSFPFSN